MLVPRTFFPPTFIFIFDIFIWFWIRITVTVTTYRRNGYADLAGLRTRPPGWFSTSMLCDELFMRWCMMVQRVNVSTPGSPLSPLFGGKYGCFCYAISDRNSKGGSRLVSNGSYSGTYTLPSLSTTTTTMTTKTYDDWIQLLPSLQELLLFLSFIFLSLEDDIQRRMISKQTGTSESIVSSDFQGSNTSTVVDPLQTGNPESKQTKSSKSSEMEVILFRILTTSLKKVHTLYHDTWQAWCRCPTHGDAYCIYCITFPPLPILPQNVNPQSSS